MRATETLEESKNDVEVMKQLDRALNTPPSTKWISRHHSR
jgi:hypothetical protein